MQGQVRLIVGSALCSVTAVVLCLVLRSSSVEDAVPLFFIPIVVLVAMRFGVLAGVLGTVLSSLIFAVYLFPPLHHASVSDPYQKSNLGWLLMGGIALSGLFGRWRRPK